MDIDYAFELFEKLRPFLCVYMEGKWHWLWRPNMVEGEPEKSSYGFFRAVKRPTFEQFLGYLNEKRA